MRTFSNDSGLPESNDLRYWLFCHHDGTYLFCSHDYMLTREAFYIAVDSFVKTLLPRLRRGFGNMPSGILSTDEGEAEDRDVC